MARYLAIEIEPSGISAAAATLRGGNLTLERVHVRPDWGASLNLANAEALGRQLRELIQEGGLKAAPVLLTVGRDRIILKDIVHPPAAPADEPLIVRFQAVKELSDAPDDMVMDYLPLGRANVQNDQKALAVFIRKEYLNAAKTLCESAGLKLAGITPRPFALAASLRQAIKTLRVTPPADPAGAVGLVTLHPMGGEFVVSKGSTILFTRPITGAAIRNDASLIAELKRNLTIYATQHPTSPLQGLYIPEGPGTAGSNWSSFLSEELPLPVQGYDAMSGSPLEDTVPPPVRSLIASPLGALSLKAESDTLPINFVTPRQPRAERTKINPRILIGILAGVAIFALLGTLAYLELKKADEQLQTQMNKRDNIATQLLRREPDLKRYEAALEFSKREVVVLDELYDLATRVPNVDKAGIVEIDVTALPPPKKEPQRPVPAASTVPSGVKPLQRAAVTPAAKKEEPVATMRIVVRASNPDDPQRIADDFAKDDKFYVGVSKSKPNSQSAGKEDPTFTITAKVFHRGPDKYTRVLKATMPKLEAAPEPTTDVGFNGGFGGQIP